MFFILSLCLLPLGLITALASIDAARDGEIRRTEQAGQRLALKASEVRDLLQRTAGAIRSASAAVALSPQGTGICGKTLERLTRTQSAPGRYALYSAGRLRCASAGYAVRALVAGRPGGSLMAIDPDKETLRFALYDDSGRIEGAGEFGRAALADLTMLPGTARNFDLDLLAGDRALALRRDYRHTALVQTVTTTSPIDAALGLRMRSGAIPMAAADIALILLPVLMWLVAATAGWVIVDRLLLRPLIRMQRAISGYRPGDERLEIPVSSSPAREIGALGTAFNQLSRTVAEHEGELEAALARQKLLVREVHHRVKNNLQVVASLLNLHARAAVSEDASAAYASIQRRVDALAVVHRNHYAELEENRGVALRPLISELGANLRGTAPAAAANMAIRLDIEPLYVTQDVAVAIAFLITEIVEFAMFCQAQGVTVTLESRNPTTALLAVESDSLREGQICDQGLFARFDRIVTGLSRQLRSSLERDTENGCYALIVAVAGKEGS